MVGLAGLLVAAGAAVGLILSFSRNPVALVRVVDAAGKPVAGAVVQPAGLRIKSGPYQSGWYGWFATGRTNYAPKPLLQTDRDGYVKLEYPKYVIERLETGTVIFTVDHPDFAAQQPERMVNDLPPRGSPWRDWFHYLAARLTMRQLTVPVDPVVLERGVALQISARTPQGEAFEGWLTTQVSGQPSMDSNFWQRIRPGVLMTRRMKAGRFAVRVVGTDSNGAAWFSQTTEVDVTGGKTNELSVVLTKGVTLRGRLDGMGQGPVKNGRVIAHIWPTGLATSDNPPQWHAWTVTREDGTFEIQDLPAGDLELVALCDGFVSTNGPGKFKMRYPQKWDLGSNDLTVGIGMEPTVKLRVRVVDENGKPIEGAMAVAWPNIRYGEWAAVILGQDCYNTLDALISGRAMGRIPDVADYSGKTDSNGVATMSNLPWDITEISVQHPKYALPAVQDPTGGQKRRQVSVKLAVGVTNEISVQMEPADKAPIGHF